MRIYLIKKINKYVFNKISLIKLKHLFFIIFIAFIVFIQKIRISGFPMIPEELSVLNVNFAAEPLLDGKYFKTNANIDNSNLNLLPFQFLAKICNLIGIYGYDVYLIRYLIHFTILGILIFIYFSEWGKKRIYASLFALVTISTTLIYDQILIYTPRLNTLIVFICIILWFKRNIVEQKISLIGNFFLGSFVFVYSFGLFSNVGNSSILVFLLCWQIIHFCLQNLLKKPSSQSQKIRLLKIMSIPYLLILPSLILSFILLLQSKTNVAIAQILPTFPTYSFGRLIQGRGAWWEEGYLPWFDELQNQLLIEFRYATFLIVFLPLMLIFLLKCLKIFFGFNTWNISIPEERREYIILLFAFILFLIITLYFPSRLMMELNPLLAIYREPWSKFGPVFIIFFGKLLTLSLSYLYSLSQNILRINFYNRNTEWFVYLLILIILFNSINPKRIPTSSFDSSYNLAIDKNYANYISSKTLKINYILNKNPNLEYAYCIVPGSNLYSDIALGRWFIAFSKNIPHYVEGINESNLGGNPYSQLGVVIESCGKLQIEVGQKIDIIHICLPYYGETKFQYKRINFRIHQNRNVITYCDYKFRYIPINSNLVR
jgi:hypothetical protein